jgi:tripartite ATP-independent transporter DctM subunit
VVFVLAFFLDYFELAFIIVPLLGAVAKSLGIDLIWFGVLLAVNMQTSFMHPPFGFSLFYLRSVAPNRAYRDKVTGRTIAPVTTGQIYLGAIPFVMIQIVMVAIVITFPGLVTHYKSGHIDVDPTTININVPMPDADGANPFGAPAAPDFGSPSAPGGQPAPAQPGDPLPAPDFK